MTKIFYILSFLLLISINSYSQQSSLGKKIFHAVSDSLKSQSALDSIKSYKLSSIDSLQPALAKTLKDSLSKRLPSKSLPAYNNNNLERVENNYIGKAEQLKAASSKIDSFKAPQFDSAFFKDQIKQQTKIQSKALKTLPQIDTTLINSYTDSTYLVNTLENEVAKLVAPQLSELDQNALGLNSYTDHFAENNEGIEQLQAKLSKKNLNAVNLFSKVDTLNKVSLKDRMKVKPRISVLGLNPIIIQADGALIYKLGEELQIGGGLRYQIHILLKDQDDFRIYSSNQAFGGLTFANLLLPKSFSFFIEGFYEFESPSFKPTIGITKDIEILHKVFSFMIIYDPKITESLQFGIRL